jgi:type III restriction enzyme
MTASFFEKPILNSPYGYPGRYWELDGDGQPTNRIMESRRRAEFITPIPKPKKRKDVAEQTSLVTAQYLFVVRDSERLNVLKPVQKLPATPCK